MGTNLIRLCNIAELPDEGHVREITVGRQALCVARVNGMVTALENECPHHGGPLAAGVLEDGKVVCPWHAYAFDLHTGACEYAAGLRARVYEVTVQGDDVMVEL